jgi:methionyl-tRNA formyltransferase
MSNSLRIVFMGTPEFAVASLHAICQSKHQVVGVVTVADKPAGRGQQIHQSAVKQYAVEHELPVVQPVKLRDEDFLQTLREWNADLFVVVAFRMLPEVVWNMPPKGTINLHGSLLPKYRGAAPINWAVINGEKETGVTTFFLQHEIDTGRVIKRATMSIDDNENAGSVHDRMMGIGAQTLVETLDAIANGTADAVAQELLMPAGETVPHAPKIFKETTLIDWTKNVDTVHNFVRGLSPYPAAWCRLDGKTAKIFAGKKEHATHSFEIGSVHTDNKSYLKIATPDGYYHLHELQLEGKKRMKVDEYLRGRRTQL